MSADNVAQPNVAHALSDHAVSPQPAADPLENIAEHDIGGARYIIVFGVTGRSGGCTPPAASWAEAGELLKQHPLYDNKAKGWFSLHYQVPWPKDTEVKIEDYFPVVEGARLLGEVTADGGPPIHPLTGEKLGWMEPLDYQAPGVLTYNKETSEWVWKKEGPPVISVSPAPEEAFVCFEGAGRGVVARPAMKKVKFSSPLTRETVKDKFGNPHVLEYTSKKQRAEQLERIEEEAWNDHLVECKGTGRQTYSRVFERPLDNELVAGTLPSDLGQKKRKMVESKSPPSITAFKVGTPVRTTDGTDRKGTVVGCAVKAKDETYLGIGFDDEPRDENGYRKTESYPLSKLEVHSPPKEGAGVEALVAMQVKVQDEVQQGLAKLRRERKEKAARERREQRLAAANAFLDEHQRKEKQDRKLRAMGICPTPPPSIVRTTSIDMKIDDETQFDMADPVDELGGELEKLG